MEIEDSGNSNSNGNIKVQDGNLEKHKINYQDANKNKSNRNKYDYSAEVSNSVGGGGYALLRRLVDSSHFSSFLCISYLGRYSENVGIQYYLCQKLRTFDHADIVFFLPQICQVLVTIETEAASLEDFLIEMCENSVHCALLTFWHLQSLLQELARDPESYGFKTCQRVFNKVQYVMFNIGEPPRRKIRENPTPALVIAGTILGGIGMPELTHFASPMALSQARVQKSFFFTLLHSKSTKSKQNKSPVSVTVSPTYSNDNTNTEQNHSHKKKYTLSHARSMPTTPTLSSSTPRSVSSSSNLSYFNASDSGVYSMPDLASLPDLNSSSRRSSDSIRTVGTHRSQPDISTANNNRDYNIYRRLSRKVRTLSIMMAPEDQILHLKIHYFRCVTQFFYAIQAISTRLFMVPKPARLSALRAELALLNTELPSEVDLPYLVESQSFGSKQRLHRIVRIPPAECTILNSAERVPFLLLIEILKDDLTFDSSTKRNHEILKSNDDEKRYMFDLVTEPNLSASRGSEVEKEEQSKIGIESEIGDLGSSPIITHFEPDNPNLLSTISNKKILEAQISDLAAGNNTDDSNLHTTTTTTTNRNDNINNNNNNNNNNDNILNKNTKDNDTFNKVQKIDNDLNNFPPLMSEASISIPESYTFYSSLETSTSTNLVNGIASNNVNHSSNNTSSTQDPFYAFSSVYSIQRRSTPVKTTEVVTDVATHMRMAALMLAQLNGPDGSKLSKDEVGSIKARIIASMQNYEHHNVYSDVNMLGGEAGERRTENDLKTGGIKPSDDPRAASFGEEWSAKRERIRKSSPYGKLKSWDLVSVIAKTGSDLRQEAFACQLIQAFGQIWEKAGVNVWVKKMRILITGESSGLVETITNGISIHSLKKALTNNSVISGNNPKGNIVSLKEYFRQSFGDSDSEAYKNAQYEFVRSLVAYSLISYILQIKDRHNGNILLDNQGHIIHIDFGFLLSNTPGRVGFEAAPFKFTYEYLDILGGPDSVMMTEFKSLMKSAFLVLRKKADDLVSLVEMMQKNSNLPCFVSGTATSQMMRQRFQLQLTKSEAEDFVEHVLIQKSLGSIYTRLYDQFQLLTQGIYC